MNQFYKKINCLAFSIMLALTSCGYVSDKPLANQEVYKSDQLQTCKIDASKLGEIFKADQKEQIRCIQENFIQFTKYVRAKNPGSVTESEINAFVRKFFEGQSDSIIKGLSLIFQLNMLLLRDEADRISRTNISPLFELLVQVNQEAIEITTILKEMDDDKNQGHFWELRERFNAAVVRFTEFTLKLIAKSPDIQQKLNIKTFIIEASKKLGNKEIDADTIDSIIFLKRVLLAGDKEVITSDELEALIKKIPSILTLSFDLFYVKSTNFASDKDHMRFYYKNLIELYKVIEFNQKDFDLFTLDQILKLAQDFGKNKSLDVKKFKPSIVALKTRMIGGSKEIFSLKDLRTVLDIVKDGVERNYFNNVTYNAYFQLLESNKPILALPQLNLPEDYDIFSKFRIAELHKDFQDVAINIRYFRDSKTNIPVYGNEIIRNKSGYVEAMMLKWGAGKLLKGYGHKNPAGLQQVNLNEFQTFLFDMKPILEEFKLWSPNPQTFARNAILLADLFQNKSNGDMEVNETETIEYLQMILSAVVISDKFSTDLTAHCDPGINKDDPVFNTECYNENFFEGILNRLNYKKFFPRLNNYVLNAPKTEVNEYLKGVQGFARDINDPKIPINNRDSILILGAMLNIESTFIRFDSNRDNVIDFKELVEAFTVYKSSIIILAKLKPNEEQYAFSIFLYMVSKMAIPETETWMQSAAFFSFHKCVSWEWCRNSMLDPIVAKRLNVGKLLYYMVKQNSTESVNARNKGIGQLLRVNE
jgi:hypothetical protein